MATPPASLARVAVVTLNKRLLSFPLQRDNVEGLSQPPNDDVIRELSRSLRQSLAASLFGIDVIINNQTGQHAVIDINAFPGENTVQSEHLLYVHHTYRSGAA